MKKLILKALSAGEVLLKSVTIYPRYQAGVDDMGNPIWKYDVAGQSTTHCGWEPVTREIKRLEFGEEERTKRIIHLERLIEDDGTLAMAVEDHVKTTDKYDNVAEWKLKGLYDHGDYVEMDLTDV